MIDQVVTDYLPVLISTVLAVMFQFVTDNISDNIESYQ